MIYFRNAWTMTAWANELAPGKPLAPRFQVAIGEELR